MTISIYHFYAIVLIPETREKIPLDGVISFPAIADEEDYYRLKGKIVKDSGYPLRPLIIKSLTKVS